jgi:hypothetical protein
MRHNDVAAEWHHLCAQALQPSAVSDEPLIHTGRGVPKDGSTGVEAAADSRGDVAAHGFWRRGTTAVFDVRITVLLIALFGCIFHHLCPNMKMKGLLLWAFRVHQPSKRSLFFLWSSSRDLSIVIHHASQDREHSPLRWVPATVRTPPVRCPSGLAFAFRC